MENRQAYCKVLDRWERAWDNRAESCGVDEKAVKVMLKSMARSARLMATRRKHAYEDSNLEERVWASAHARLFLPTVDQRGNFSILHR